MAITVNVGIRIEGTRLDDITLWDEQAMAAVTAWSVEIIVNRTTRLGIGADGEPLAAYATKAMTVGLRSETAIRLKPKGGKPAYGPGRPRRLLSASGRPPAGKSWPITGRYYDGGYREYKQASRKGNIRSAEVDLVLSGQLMRSIDAVQVTAEQGTVSIRGPAREYGPAVNEDRPFLGHHDAEMVELDIVIGEQVDRLMVGR
ncbi:MAG: hypothetical protein Q8Q14_00530 [Gemmatimonadales bacterium]|nr:hypothetical protein [Gemmatimonadales bacterium]